MSEEKTREREVKSLLAIPDNYEKMIISMDDPSGGETKGIQHVNLLDFLVEEEGESR